jgi:hypothetical protein
MWNIEFKPFLIHLEFPGVYCREIIESNVEKPLQFSTFWTRDASAIESQRDLLGTNQSIPMSCM